MRRGLASLIMGLALIVATVSWAGFTMSRTLLDPGRSERLADQLLENEQVRDALVSRLADALEAQIPDEVPVSRQLVESGAEVALDDPRVEALVRDGFVRVHQNALEGNSEPVVIDAGALGAAGRDALVGVRPELDLLLPRAPSLGLELPTAWLSWLGTVKDFVDRWTLIGAVVSIAGLLLAFVVARDRAPVLRRVAFWAFGVAAFWLVMGYALPWLIGLVSPTSAALGAAMVDVFLGAMIGPALTMAGVGAALLLASFLWPMFSGRRGAAALQTRTAQPTGPTGPTGPPPAADAGVGPGVGRVPANAVPTGRPPGAMPVTPPRAAGPMIDLSRQRPSAPPVAMPPTQVPPTPAGPTVARPAAGRPGYHAPVGVPDSTSVMPTPTARARTGPPATPSPPPTTPSSGTARPAPASVSPEHQQTRTYGEPAQQGSTTARMPERDATTVWEAGRGYLDEPVVDPTGEEQPTTRWEDNRR